MTCLGLQIQRSQPVPQVRLSIGPHNWPAPQPVTSVAEHYYQVQKAIGHVPNLSRWLYENEAFTMVFDIKKLPGIAGSAGPGKSPGEMNWEDRGPVPRKLSQI